MKKQIILIHGGDSFDNYNDYIEAIKSYKMSFERFKAKKWKDTLGEKLGKSFDVVMPKMPNSNNAKYLEWKIFFEKMIPLFNEKYILIGHSLGGIFLLKYLSENKLKNKPFGIFIISAPFTIESSNEFRINQNNLSKINNQSDNIFLYHSKDDEIVDFKEFLEYKKFINTAIFREFKNRGHFNQPTFPEIVRDIKSI